MFNLNLTFSSFCFSLLKMFWFYIWGDGSWPSGLHDGSDGASSSPTSAPRGFCTSINASLATSNHAKFMLCYIDDLMITGTWIQREMFVISSLLFSLCFTVFQETLTPVPLPPLGHAPSFEDKVLFFCQQREAVSFSSAFPKRYISIHTMG